MKKLFLGLFSLFLALATIQAQDAGKSLKAAGNALRAFELDQANNKAKLQEAVDAIVFAVESSETNGSSKAWQIKGDIYNAIASQIVQVRQLGFGSLDELPKVDNPAYEAATAYVKAYELASKKYEFKDALKGIQAAQSDLYNLGIYAFEDKTYDVAYRNFNEMIKLHKVLNEKGETSTLDDPAVYKDQMYITGLAALSADMKQEAKPMFEELVEAGYDKPGIYEALYQISAESNLDEAYSILEKGRKAYPDDVSLLFAEINHFLKADRLDELIGKLKLAIDKEPTNVSLYSTLGNVYDNLYQKSSEAGDAEKANEYFDNALDYYNQALKQKPDYFDAIYSIGALYFNRAASMTQELNKLADDLSREGQKKYDALQVEIEKEFDDALPFFKRAEKMDPNDVNTLIALKEILARKKDYETSKVFKERLEKVQGGETLEKSFYEGK